MIVRGMIQFECHVRFLLHRRPPSPASRRTRIARGRFGLEQVGRTRQRTNDTARNISNRLDSAENLRLQKRTSAECNFQNVMKYLLVKQMQETTLGKK